MSQIEDDLYRHPHYKGMYAGAFQPSFDVYSLGVVLYEIGMWRNISYKGSSRSSDPRRSPMPTHDSDPTQVEKMVERGLIMPLKQWTGVRYRDAVISCLSRDFDSIWERRTVDQQRQLQEHLELFQNTVVDKLAVCNA